MQRLKARAKAYGRSAEAEHRLILQEALCSRPKMTASLPSGKRRIEMESWLDTLLKQRFAGRILPYGTKAGLIYGELAAGARVRGRNPGFSDAQIAAVAKVNDMAVATRSKRRAALVERGRRPHVPGARAGEGVTAA